MSEGSGGEPERGQDPWSQQAGAAPPGPAAAQPEVAGHPSAGPDSWSTTWAYPPERYPQAAGQYGSQQWPGYPAAPRNNRAAIAALVCGVGQFVLGLLVVGNILLAIPAIICGAIGLQQVSRRGEAGRGMAIAGLVLGILGVVYFVIIVVVLIILGSIHHSG